MKPQVLLFLTIFFRQGIGIHFSVPESVPVGHVIGYVSGSPQISTDSKYFVVYSDDVTEKTIQVDERSGEISTLDHLDYEKKTNFEVLAIPVSGGEGIPIVVEVEDENNHAPVFADERITIEISEFARIGAEFALPMADDRDGPSYNVQKYRIAQGNVNNVFKISSRRINGVLYSDLVVNGQLDREYRDKYELIIEAIDGGKPPKIGKLRLNIVILDANDNLPIFEKPRYSITVPASTTIGANIVTIKATDADIADNAKISYRLQKTRSTSLSSFSLSSNGILSTTTHLLPGAVHDLVVVATDHGKPLLESSAFVSVTVQGSSFDAPALDIIWMTEMSTAHLPENITLGSIVARISLNEDQRDSTTTISGCPSLCMQQSDSSHVYLLLVCGLFDRESTSEYHLKFVMKNRQNDVILEHPVLLTIGDVNDNSPMWSHMSMHLALKRSGENLVTLTAVDPDQGVNGRIRYSVLDTTLIDIDPDTGTLIIPKELDCSIGNELKFRVRAEDGGKPSLFSDMEVIGDLLDPSGKAPQFEKSLYEVMIKEDSEKGVCLLKVKANNSVCGGSSRIYYSIQESDKKNTQYFSLDSSSGTICLEKQLDYEQTSVHQLTITATDQNGLLGTCLVSIRVLDVNDNHPVFSPVEYNISVREGDLPYMALLAVSATDVDEGTFGEIKYKLLSEDLPFRVDERTGELYTKNSLKIGKYDVKIGAVDGGGMRSEQPAIVHINVIARDAPSPAFTQSKYVIDTSEDILPGISIGSVQATGEGRIRYSIYSGNIDNQFIINSENGRITVARYLDADKSDTVLLNVQADLVEGASNHTQVIIRIEDHNDNYPVFALESVDVTIREDQPLHQAFYVVHATDADKKKNGLLTYSLLSSHPKCPVIVQPMTGQMQLTGPLDYERIKFYRIRVKATDAGIPPKSANMTILLHVSDVNDNAPSFTEQVYKAEILENSPPSTEVLHVNATDKDSDENSLIRYRINNGSDLFGIDEKTGKIFAKKELDREMKSIYNLSVVAEDKGQPSLSSTTTVFIKVLDVNDNAPSCSSLTTLVVPSDADTQSPFGSIVISDPDEGENGTVVYRSQQAHPIFLLNANGDVRLRRRLVDSDPSDFRISVIASDSGNPKKSSVCHVPIKVTRGKTSIIINEPSDSTVRIPSDCVYPCVLKVIEASGVHKWMIQSSPVSTHFSIVGGHLKLNSVPVTLPPWIVIVLLFDNEGRQKMLQIKVLPALSKNLQATVSLPPSLAIGSKVGVIGDVSTSSSIYYTISNQTDIFELDQVTGNVFLTSRLRDYSGQNLRVFFQKVHALEDVSEDMEILFEINGNIEQVPRFEREIMEIEVSEDVPIDFKIATVTATVMDFNTSISYRLVEQSDVFAVDQYSGDVTVTGDIDWFESIHYNLVVEAYTKNTKSTVLLKIRIIDVNNNRPEIVSSPEILILPDSPSQVHRVVAFDRDSEENAKISFEIIESGFNCFSIDKSTGVIKLEKQPEKEHYISVRAMDNGKFPLFSDQRIKIRLLKTSKYWRYFDRSEYVFNVTNSLSKGSVIGKIMGNGSAHVRSLLIPIGLVLDGEELKVVGKLVPGEHRFNVLATSGENRDWATVTLTVTSTQESPRISSTSCGTVTIPENQSIIGFKQIVGRNIKKFKLQETSTLFELDEKTGFLSCSGLDRETKVEHLLVIQAIGEHENDSCTVRVIVSDINDNSPQFSASTPQLIVLEDKVKVGNVALQLIATDPDFEDNGKIFYQLIEDPSMMFDVEPYEGKLVYSRNLALKETEWMIRIRLSDSGDEPLSTDRFIRVRDERSTSDEQQQQQKLSDEKPSFLRNAYVTDINEAQEKGQTLVQVSTTSSRDSRIAFSIVEGNVDGVFDIDSEGIIRSAQELDHEIRSSYLLRVIGTGSFPGEISTTVEVKVNNINDNPPAFPKLRNRKISESVPIGTFIATVTANDADLDDVIEYYLIDNNNNFIIDRYTGSIHTSRLLDYEEEKEIRVVVMASDGTFNATGMFLLTLIDENDNTPQFHKRFYDLKISPSAQPDDVIVHLIANDRDSGVNGNISYSLEDSDDNFSISNEGVITLLTPLSKESEYLITVTATDHGSPRKSSSVPVRITVTDEIPTEQPRFQKSEYDFLINEDHTVMTSFGNVSIGDKPFYYRIMDKLYMDWIDIDRLGRLFLKKSLDREKKDSMEFRVDVGGENSGYHQNSTTTVRLRVGDVNDNLPKFMSDQIAVVVKNGLHNGDTITRLSATDADIGDNGKVTYRILTGNDYGIVTLASDTGALMFNQWNDDLLDQFPNGTWVTVVEARDHGHPSRSSLVHLHMSVAMSSWASTAPFFVQSQYVIHVPETTSLNTVIFRSRAVNRAGIAMHGLRYQLMEKEKTFAMDANTGEIRLRNGLDYESKDRYKLTVKASDVNGRSAVVGVEVRVVAVDEYAPVFTSLRYTFQIPLGSTKGYEVGNVRAVDADGDVHGEVQYTIEDDYKLVAVDKKTGKITLTSDLRPERNHTIEQLSITAFSSATKKSKATVYLEIGGMYRQSSLFSTLTFKIAAVGTGLLFCVLLTLLICCVCCRRNTIKEVESPKKQVYSVSKGQIAVLSSDVSRMSPSYGQHHPTNVPPPQTVSMTSSASTSSGIRSAMSHRDFVSTRSQPDSGIDPDAVSVNSSVTDYLVSIGVNPNPVPPKPRSRRRDTVDSQLNELIYARVDDVVGPGPIDVSRRLDSFDNSSSMMTSTHSNIMPSFQPLTEIFTEVQRMQQEERQQHQQRREYVQIEI